MGVAVVEETDRDVQDVIERADLALYAAKSSGRDVVMTRPLYPYPERAVFNGGDASSAESFEMRR